MKGDFSRVTFNPKKHYSSVLYQQGRVLTDADFNEAQAIRKYRAEMTATHVIGPSGTPKFDSIDGQPLPNGGFALSIGVDGDLVVGRGHYYVEGILCENEADVAYRAQPYLPDSPILVDTLQAEGATVGLIYLDVFERERTALDHPELREGVLGGPDTTARAEVIWQVKMAALPNAPTPVTCEDEHAEWKAIIGPRTPLMAVDTPPVSPDDAPCDAPPDADFLGPENQLYRVEVHSTDASGSRSATRFKWSRENASVVARIERVDAITSGTATGNLLGVHSTGRDSFLGFHTDDWVEYIDDQLELTSGAGLLVQIANIDPEINEITLSGNITVRFDRNPKLRRWDQGAETSTRNGGTGTVANSADGVAMNGDDATWLLLEHNVWVQFADEVYRPGDYWLFAARAATGSVDFPTGFQPAAGVTHHYARLGYVSLDGAGILQVLLDCRILFPPLTNICAEDVCYDNSNCDLNAKTVQEALEALCQREPGEGGGCLCTITLGENGVKDLQTAIDSLPEGGCICIPAGNFLQPTPVKIDGRTAITIKGCGTASNIRYELDDPLFILNGSKNITLQSFKAECSIGGFIRIENCNRIEIEDCTVESRQAVAFGISGRNMHLTVEGCFVSANQAFVFRDYQIDGLFVRQNHLETLEQTMHFEDTDRLVNAHIQGNTMEGSRRGLMFNFLAGASDVTIVGNRITPVGDESIAVQVGLLEQQSLVTLTDNTMGIPENPAIRGLLVELMVAESRVVLERNHMISVSETVQILKSEANTQVHANANIFRSAASVPTVSMGSTVDQDQGLGHVLFSNNQIYSDKQSQLGTVILNARRLVVMGNYVADQEGENGTSIRLPRTVAAAIGNVSNNGVNLEGVVTPNIIVVNNAVY